jgi:hypothetical protein
MSCTSWMLGSIPTGGSDVFMFYSVFVFSCVGGDLMTGQSPPPKKAYKLSYKLVSETHKTRGLGPHWFFLRTKKKVLLISRRFSWSKHMDVWFSVLTLSHSRMRKSPLNIMTGCGLKGWHYSAQYQGCTITFLSKGHLSTSVIRPLYWSPGEKTWADREWALHKTVAAP